MDKSIIFKDAKEIQEDLIKLKALQQEPCEDCISRQAVIDIIEKEEFKGDALSEIEKLLSVNPQKPKTGHWIKSSIGGAKICSICQAHMGLSSFKYCPNCGARMEGGAE